MPSTPAIGRESASRVPPGSLVLVTGASGYVGGRLVTVLLERGYRVRCLVRTPAKVLSAPWSSEVEIGGEPTGVPEATLAQAGASLEHQTVTAEESVLVEQPQKMVLGDIQQRRTVGVATTGAMPDDQGSGEGRGHSQALPTRASSGVCCEPPLASGISIFAAASPRDEEETRSADT